MKSTLFAVTALAAMVCAQADSLTIGDKAPKLDVAKWVKGAPVKEFKKGNIYVVEFWATWCGPCRVSIPHITELAHKFKDKVTFIGVDVWETQAGSDDISYMVTVEEFVKEMGDQMDYNVAIDGPKGTMAKTWMEAAEQNGIPTAFIVNKDGLIVWIGHPMMMDDVLAKVVEGNYDVQTAKAEFERQKAEEEAMEKLYAKLGEAYGSGDIDAVIKELDKAIAEMPVIKDTLLELKLQILMEEKPEQVVSLARELFKGDKKDDATFLNNTAWWMVEEDKPPVKMDYKLALAMAERACELTKHEDPMNLDTLALAHFRNGNVKKAIEIQEKAIKLLAKDERVSKEMIEEFQSRLKKFKEKIAA